MIAKINSIADKGIKEKERLVIKILKQADIGEFAVFRAGYRDDSVTTGVRDVFWFPDKNVSEGDLVVLYSKSGKVSEKKLNNGKMAHFFYWGKDMILWNKNDIAPVLLHIDEWSSLSPNNG